MQDYRVAKSSLPAHARSERRLARDVLPLRPRLRFRRLGVTRSNERLGSRLGQQSNHKGKNRGTLSNTARTTGVPCTQTALSCLWCPATYDCRVPANQQLPLSRGFVRLDVSFFGDVSCLYTYVARHAWLFWLDSLSLDFARITESLLDVRMFVLTSHFRPLPVMQGIANPALESLSLTWACKTQRTSQYLQANRRAATSRYM